MAIVDDRLREELRTRFSERLQEPVRLQLFIKPGSSRLILPSGVGCPTCPDAREIAEAIAEAGGERISLEVVDITVQPDGVDAVPTIRIGPLVGLSEQSLDRLNLIKEPVEVMIFTTPG
jgi:hypothetical protein